MNIFKNLFSGGSKEPIQCDDNKFKRLIADLSIPPKNEDMQSKQAIKAWMKLESMSTNAVPAMMGCLNNTEVVPEVATTLIYMLAKFPNLEIAKAIAAQLSSPDANVRFEAITALQNFNADILNSDEVRKQVIKASSDDNANVSNIALEICRVQRYGEMEIPPWHAGTADWESLAKAFIKIELVNESPDYKTLKQKLAGFQKAECHGAWIRIAQEISDSQPKQKMLAYLEALKHDPDPDSVAWDWLNGSYNSSLNIISRGASRSLKTVNKAIAELKG